VESRMGSSVWCSAAESRSDRWFRWRRS